MNWFSVKNIIFCSIVPIFLYGGWQEEKESLEEVYFINEFRIFYSKDGKHKLPDHYMVDLNENMIPDYIEDIASQLTLSSEIFTKTLGFKHPLESVRYSNIVKYIDVHILNSKTGGGAGDAIIDYNYKAFKNQNKALSINLSNNLKLHSLTPMHEMFHLIQNGYTMFKNGWYTEGTARWSESIFKKGTGLLEELPNNVQVLENNILNQLYSTSVYWNKIAYLCGESRNFNIPINIQNKYVDGTLIIEDNKIFGYDFIKAIFDSFEKKDKEISTSKGYPKYDWLEKEQKSSDNNRYLLCAMKETIANKCQNINQEVVDFVTTIDLYTNYKCK